MIESIDDRALFIEMDRENRQREDLRPYEQGLMYHRALAKGLYPSLRALCEGTGANLGNSSLVLRLAKFPEEVLDAFQSRLDIQYRWIQPLIGVLQNSPEVVLACAKEIIESRKAGTDNPSADVYAKLVNVGVCEEPKGSPGRSKVQPIVVNGKTVASILCSKNGYSIQFEKDALPPDKAQKLEVFIQKLLG